MFSCIGRTSEQNHASNHASGTKKRLELPQEENLISRDKQEHICVFI